MNKFKEEDQDFWSNLEPIGLMQNRGDMVQKILVRIYMVERFLHIKWL